MRPLINLCDEIRDGQTGSKFHPLGIDVTVEQPRNGPCRKFLERLKRLFVVLLSELVLLQIMQTRTDIAHKRRAHFLVQTLCVSLDIRKEVDELLKSPIKISSLVRLLSFVCEVFG